MTKIEDVKRAIAKEMGYRDPDTVHFAARATIAAMREPTEAMLKAGDLSDDDMTKKVWQAMIDAALEEISNEHD